MVLVGGELRLGAGLSCEERVGIILEKRLGSVVRLRYKMLYVK